jgi:hypothetical protein
MGGRWALARRPPLVFSAAEGHESAVTCVAAANLAFPGLLFPKGTGRGGKNLWLREVAQTHRGAGPHIFAPAGAGK